MTIKIVAVDDKFIARSVSFLWWKRIYTGTLFNILLECQQEAVIAHETAHCNWHHSELRVLTLLFCPFLIKRICRWTEFVADRYAAKVGLGYALITVLRLGESSSWMYPSHEDRIKAIKLYVSKSRNAR